MLSISLKNEETVLKQTVGEEDVSIDYHAQYALGDYYEVRVEQPGAYLHVQLDEGLMPALIYVSGMVWRFSLPFNTEREWPYPDGAFLGKNHYAWVRKATTEEVQIYRNLAVNSHDYHESDAFPHIVANAETRNEMVFSARNAIDGVLANTSHGNYPYQSWGIDKREDAKFTLDFGRSVTVNKVGLLLRADYPHDTYWTQATINFSDGSSLTLDLKKDSAMQWYSFEEKKIGHLTLHNLIRFIGEDTGIFPALTQIVVKGRG